MLSWVCPAPSVSCLLLESEESCAWISKLSGSCFDVFSFKRYSTSELKVYVPHSKKRLSIIGPIKQNKDLLKSACIFMRM